MQLLELRFVQINMNRSMNDRCRHIKSIIRKMDEKMDENMDAETRKRPRALFEANGEQA